MPNAFKRENSATVTDILDGTIKLEGKKVAVIGSGMTGLETSELLVSKGNDVTIVEMADSIAPGAWFQSVDDAMQRLNDGKVKFLTSHKLIGIDDDGVNLENIKEDCQVHIKADFTVLSLGVRPDNELYNELKDSSDYRVINIGDCKKIGRIANATESAFEAVMSII